MTNAGRRDKESCAEDHRKRTETPFVAEFWGHRDLSTPLPMRQSADLESVPVVAPHLAARSGSPSAQAPSMTCPLCGDVCVCVPDVRSSAFSVADSGVGETARAVLHSDASSAGSRASESID